MQLAGSPRKCSACGACGVLVAQGALEALGAGRQLGPQPVNGKDKTGAAQRLFDQIMRGGEHAETL